MDVCCPYGTCRVQQRKSGRGHGGFFAGLNNSWDEQVRAKRPTDPAFSCIKLPCKGAFFKRVPPLSG